MKEVANRVPRGRCRKSAARARPLRTVSPSFCTTFPSAASEEVTDVARRSTAQVNSPVFQKPTASVAWLRTHIASPRCAKLCPVATHVRNQILGRQAQSCATQPARSPRAPYEATRLKADASIRSSRSSGPSRPATSRVFRPTAFRYSRSAAMSIAVLSVETSSLVIDVPISRRAT